LLFGDRIQKDEEGFDSQPPFELDTEKQKVVVQTVFKKAQSEHLYASFYSDLCAAIVRMELLMKGFRPNRSNIRECHFRTELLNYCKESFETFLVTSDFQKKKNEQESEEDRLERELRTKHKLFGNIEFVGELYKQQIVTDFVI